jgi:hypothetical protein
VFVVVALPHHHPRRAAIFVDAFGGYRFECTNQAPKRFPLTQRGGRCNHRRGGSLPAPHTTTATSRPNHRRDGS